MRPRRCGSCAIPAGAEAERLSGLSAYAAVRKNARGAAFVTPGNRVADVGCDHGYLAIWLCAENIVPSALALDVNPGPLSAARQNIAARCLEAYIQTRLSDDLRLWSRGSGYGGDRRKGATYEPDSPGGEAPSGFCIRAGAGTSVRAGEVRRCLSGLGFQIVLENMVREAGNLSRYPRSAGKRPGAGDGGTEVWALPAAGRPSCAAGISEKEEKQLVLLSAGAGCPAGKQKPGKIFRNSGGLR